MDANGRQLLRVIFSKSFILLASQESSSWNTLLRHLKTLDSLRQCFMAT
jgi:hypothetical protein